MADVINNPFLRACKLYMIQTYEQLQTKQETMADEQDKAVREFVFKHFDLNGDGKISAAELADRLKELGDVSVDEVEKMMAEIDTDGDGFISFEEFTVFALANPGLIRDVAKVC